MTKFYYIIVCRNTIDGTNWGYYTEPGQVYFVSASSEIEDHSTHFEWTEYISTARLFENAEDAWSAINTLWRGSAKGFMSVLIISEETLLEETDELTYHINARAEKQAREQNELAQQRQILENLDRITNSLTKMRVSLPS